MLIVSILKDVEMPRPKPFEPDYHPTDLELGWLAGFFEGEGSFNVTRGRPRMSINQTDLDLLEHFQQLTGSAGTIGPMKGSALSVKPLWQWRTNSIAEAQYVISLLYEHLGPRRRAKADEVRRLQPQRAKLVRGGKCINGHDLVPRNIEEHPKSNSIQCRICVNAKRRARYALTKAIS